MFLLILLLAIAPLAHAVPPKSVPTELNSAFTSDGKIRILNNYADESYLKDTAVVFTADQIKKSLKLASANTFLTQALMKYKSCLSKKNVAVINSANPICESLLLNYEAYPTTISERPIVCEDSRIEILSAKEDLHSRKFDAVFAISVFDYLGLGRYGDIVDPDGDLKAMDKMKALLSDEGLLFLSVPVGQDCLIWNSHRVYGKIRLKALLKCWRIVEYFGFSSENLENAAWEQLHQPVFVLKPIK